MALTNKLSAIGNAIRSKTGGTELLTLDQMPTAIASIETGGGKVEGTFTLINDATPPQIEHNLGTSKIAVIFYPTSTIVAHAGYRNYSLCYINLYPFITGQTWVLDYTPYNSGRFPNPVEANVNNYTDYPRLANGQASPWTSQSDFKAGTFYGVGRSGYTVTDTTFKVKNTFCSGTYKYIIWALA